MFHSLNKKNEAKSAGSEGSEDLEARINDSSNSNDEVLIAKDTLVKAKHYLKGNPISLYCTNLKKIMGGRTNLWSKSKNRLGVVNKDGSKVSPNVFSSTEGAFDDGKLEFATFDSLFGLITNKCQRLAQEEGPLEIKFARSDYLETYMNIDGEFYKLTNPLSITIQKADKITRDGTLRVLVNEKSNAFKK